MLFVLAGVAATGAAVFVATKTGLSLRDIAHDPAYAAARLGMAVDSDFEEVNHSGDSITIHNRRTGKTATLRFGDLRNGNFRFMAGSDGGKTASIEIGSGERKLPKWVPVYPGANASGGVTAFGDDGEKAAEGGTVAYRTSDSASDVFKFYQQKARDAGMTVNIVTTHTDGGMMVLKDDSQDRRLTVIVATDSGHTTISLNYAGKD